MNGDQMTGLTGRWHPNEWKPEDRTSLYTRPRPGQLLGFRYAAWQVGGVTPRADIDLTDEDQAAMNTYPPSRRENGRPYVALLLHQRGPLLFPQQHLERLHDGTTRVHVGVPAGAHWVWHTLPERYPVCVCHGHPYPCMAYAAEQVAAAEAKRLDRLLAAHAPAVCASCLEPISSRQKAITFPEPSLLLPGLGIPGPTFHASRGSCYRDARLYELDRRLPEDPDATRLASCPGALFRHQGDGRTECTAERWCTGHHGPQGRLVIECTERLPVAINEGCYPRPPGLCPADRCLGRDPTPGAPDPLSIGDELFRRRLWREVL